MSTGLCQYFERRASEEEHLAAAAIHRSVRATHARFAAAYRAELVQALGGAEIIGRRQIADQAMLAVLVRPPAAARAG